MLKSRFGFEYDATIRRVVPFLFHPRVHPNALSALGTAISLLAAADFASGNFRRGGVLTALGGAFDLVAMIFVQRVLHARENRGRAAGANELRALTSLRESGTHDVAVGRPSTLSLPHHHESIRGSVGQRPQEHRVDHAEDRGVRADAEGQRQHGDDGKAGTAPE